MRVDARIRLWKTIFAMAFAGALVAGGMAQTVEAAPITFHFEGPITFVSPALAGTFNTTQTMSGSYTFDSTTPDAVPANPTVGEYVGALTTLTFTINGYTGGLGGGLNDILVLDNFDGLRDEYNARASSPSGASVGGLAPFLFGLFLADFTQFALSNDLLPTNPSGLIKVLIECVRPGVPNATWYQPTRSHGQGNNNVLDARPRTKYHAPSWLRITWSCRIWEEKVL